ncbi:MAG: bifunctional metallophosphatase/5'-nucleotidase [Actinomycetota bacterium]
MHQGLRWIIGVLLLTLAAACARGEPGAPGSMQNEGDVVAITLLHLNDVYELTPVSGGAEGGLARVATLRKQLRKQNPNTYTILAGDLLNPSALSTATVDDRRLSGRQMVDVMNVLGLDYATFGNHEFDLKQEELTQRLGESKFTWFSSNVADANAQPLPKIPPNVVFTVKNEAGKQARIGLFGVTVNSNPATYITYRDPVEAAKEQVGALRDKVDVLIAVTHLNLEGDIQLVQQVPEIDVVVGGHEHENAQVWRGQDFTPILKADANARAVYVHHLRYDTKTKKLETEANLKRVTAEIPDDLEVAKAVDRWVKAAFAGFKAQGFDPEHVVTKTTEALDGREASVRNFPTRLTELVATGMVRAAPGTELAVFNAGSIRIDDVLPPGEVTEYDIIRTLPFGGIVLSAEIKGSLLQKVLDQGKANAGTGGYLQSANVTRSPEGNQWLINGGALDPARSYQVAINDFLVSGREIKLGFLTRDNPAVSKIADHGDIRKALISELQKTYGAR